MALVSFSPQPFDPYFRLVDATTLNKVLAAPQYSSQDGITATPSGTQATSILLLATVSRITTVAAGNDGVKLPPSAPGLVLFVTNDAVSNSMQVFGSGTDTINDIATATGIAQAAGTTFVYVCTKQGLWYVPTAPGSAGSFTSLAVSGNATVSGYVLESTGNALTAVGTNRATSLALTKQINNVTTALSGTGVTLPAGVAGMRITIFNNGANPIAVYGNGSDTIDGSPAATGVVLTNALRADYFCVAAATFISAQLGVVSA